jgi:hypothetical protein
MNRAQAASAGREGVAGLLRLVADRRPGADRQLITKAYEVAAHCHQGQQRKSGDPYITHPLAVATILAETGADDQALCAGLLHDVIEDTPCTLTALRSEFGAEIADLVHGTMALDAAADDPLPAAGRDAGLAAAFPADNRILVIMLADRLHNMRTVRHLPRAKQVQKSRQTLEVLVPAARALRMAAIESELADLASATLQRHHQRPLTASGRMLAATTALLPASARWREEWLAELHVLPTRHERVTFAAQIVLGIGRLAITLHQPHRSSRWSCRTALATVVGASELVLASWKTATVIVTAAVAVLAAFVWVLRSDDRT